MAGYYGSAEAMAKQGSEIAGRFRQIHMVDERIENGGKAVNRILR